MSKERLEKIKEKFNFERLGEFIDAKLVSPYDLKWLIEQVELFHQAKDKQALIKSNIKLSGRVQELEGDVEYLSHNFGIETEQNKRYREALEFYASEEIHEPVLRSEAVYENGICISPPDMEPPVIFFDKGEKAREALEGEE